MPYRSLCLWISEQFEHKQVMQHLFTMQGKHYHIRDLSQEKGVCEMQKSDNGSMYYDISFLAINFCWESAHLASWLIEL